MPVEAGRKGGSMCDVWKIGGARAEAMIGTGNTSVFFSTVVYTAVKRCCEDDVQELNDDDDESCTLWERRTIEADVYR